MGEMLTEALGIRNETALASDSGALDQEDQQLKRNPKTVSSSPAMSAKSLETTGGAPTNSWEASKKGFLSLALNLDGDQMNRVGVGVGWISRWGSKGEEREGRETFVCLQLFDRSCTKRSFASGGLGFWKWKRADCFKSLNRKKRAYTHVWFQTKITWSRRLTFNWHRKSQNFTTCKGKKSFSSLKLRIVSFIPRKMEINWGLNPGES